MQAEIFEFQWHVYKGGYRWIDTIMADAKGEKGSFLTESQPIGASGLAIRRYNPLALYSGLFRVLAETEPTCEGIKGFADRFGPLGRSVETAIALLEPRPMKGQYVGVGETRAAWWKQIAAMRQAVDLWDQARKGDIESLRRVIRWTDKGVHYLSGPGEGEDEGVRLRPDSTYALIAAEQYRPELLERFRPNDVVEPALHHVQRVVNKHLNGRASPRLLWGQDRSQLGVYIVPDSLIGALWLQFAKAIERDSEFRRCVECGIWFEVSPQMARSNRVYCSNACRAKAYRKRQAEARRLHVKGLSESEIANRLNADVDAVKGWIVTSQTTSRPRRRG